jgi:glycosyltransferase involved in cell wall biosynthesis
VTSSDSTPRVLLDVTDLVEFLQRQESVSGVQRVIAETAPLMLVADPRAAAVVLDRQRGVFVELTPGETTALITNGVGSANRSPDRQAMAAASGACLQRASTGSPIPITSGTVLVFLGAVWINDALMMAAREAHAAGARCVYLLYDLTPVLETGHTAAVNQLFDRYLLLITQTGSAVPAISASSRRDYEQHCAARGWITPPGDVTGLPCGLSPSTLDGSQTPWPRPYALFVGTVEARKNHLLAMRGWQQLIERHGADVIPDLVCVGRLGWHSADFLREYVATRGLDGKVSVLSASVSDADLARFYAYADFTVYPSRYEGWGLPVSESLAFGKVPVVADNSSLPEAGGDLAVYFATDDVDDFVQVIEQSVLDEAARAELEQRIADAGATSISWSDVAEVVAGAAAGAITREARDPVFPEVELGREYMVAVGPPPPDSGYADQYLAYLQSDGLTPLLGQPRGQRDVEVVDAGVVGQFGSPQAWGNELRPGRRVDFRVTRPADGPLTLLVSTRSMPGVATIEAAGPGGPLREELYLGSVITLGLGDGRAGEPAQVSVTVVDAVDSVEGFVGIRSFVVLRADDLTTQVLAHKAAASALRQELDFVMNTRSWKITAPLRRMKGRSAGA